MRYLVLAAVAAGAVWVLFGSPRSHFERYEGLPDADLQAEIRWLQSVGDLTEEEQVRLAAAEDVLARRRGW